jgi:hypothetical protein
MTKLVAMEYVQHPRRLDTGLGWLRQMHKKNTRGGWCFAWGLWSTMKFISGIALRSPQGQLVRSEYEADGHWRYVWKRKIHRKECFLRSLADPNRVPVYLANSDRRITTWAWPLVCCNSWFVSSYLWMGWTGTWCFILDKLLTKAARLNRRVIDFPSRGAADRRRSRTPASHLHVLFFSLCK